MGVMTRRAAPMLAGLLVVGCGGPRDPAGFAWTGSYETIDGTAVIQNEGPMVAAGDLGLRLLWRTPPRPVDLNDTTWESRRRSARPRRGSTCSIHRRAG